MPAFRGDELRAQLRSLVAAVGGLQIGAELPEGQDAEGRLEGDVERASAGMVQVHLEPRVPRLVRRPVVDLDLVRIERERRRGGQEREESEPQKTGFSV